uniref:Uncharacterized protein n=1 Tax=Spodoptera exigua multiple nucleopolyhedrovirus TaxID=10454 RepID=A0A6N0C2G0_9ABAC|nr:hypothetical protein [Spodoptera exigua multiple nucleopolyhedrovirus]
MISLFYCRRLVDRRQQQYDCIKKIKIQNCFLIFYYNIKSTISNYNLAKLYSSSSSSSSSSSFSSLADFENFP